MMRHDALRLRGKVFTRALRRLQSWRRLGDPLRPVDYRLKGERLEMRALLVVDLNAPPELIVPPPQEVDEELSLSFALDATDPDEGQALTFSIAGVMRGESALDPGVLGMSLDPDTGAFQWTPGELDDGIYIVSFTVTDDGEPPLADSATVEITVWEVNQPPLLTVPEVDPVVKTITRTFTAAAADADVVAGVAQSVSFSLLDPGHGAMIGADTGAFTWTPTEDQGPSGFLFTIRASDGELYADQVVSIATLDAGIVDGDLLVVGTSADDGISIDWSSEGTVNVTVNSLSSSFDASLITGQVVVRGFDGGDAYVVHFAGGGTSTTVVNDSGTMGIDELVLNATANDDPLVVTDGQVLLAGETVEYLNMERLLVNALGGADPIALTSINPATETTVDGGSDADTLNAQFAGDFVGTLTVVEMETTHLSTAGNFGALDEGGVETAAGRLTVVEGSLGTGALTSLVVGGAVTPSSVIDAASVNFASIGGDMLGTIRAHGAGTITQVTIGGTLGGSITAEEDENPGSGTLSDVTAGEVSETGVVDGGAITSIRVERDMLGTILAHGAGTLTQVTIGGTLGGSVTAAEDENPGSGTLSDVTAGAVSETGVIDGGAITSIRVERDMLGTILAHGAGTLTQVTIGGTLGGSVTAAEDENPGSGTLSDVTAGAVAETGVIDGGAITAIRVERDMLGTILAHGAGTLTQVTIGGTLGGSVTAAEDENPGSGTLSDVTAGEVSETGVIDGGAITAIRVERDMLGTILAHGAGTLTQVTIGGTLGGSVTAAEDENPGSGALTDVTAGAVSGTGVIDGGAITAIRVERDMLGTILAHGAGTLTQVTIGGTLGGSVTAAEDENPGSGTLTDVTAGAVSGTGVIDGGAITAIRVERDMLGTILAHGAGTLTQVTIGGTLGGSVTAAEDENPGSGTLSDVTAGAVSDTGVIDGGAITSIRVERDMLGTILAHGAGTLTQVTIGGTLGGSVTAAEDENPGSGTLSDVTAGEVSETGVIDGGAITAIRVERDMFGTILAHGAGVIGTLTIGGDLNGAVTAAVDAMAGSGKFEFLFIGGAMTGQVSAGTLQFGRVVGAFAGQLLVSQTLVTWVTEGGTSGTVDAFDILTIAARNAVAHSPVLNVIEAGVQRQLTATLPSGGPAPATVFFDYFYDSIVPEADPQLAVRVKNGDASTPADDVRFDLALVTSTAAEFDLARLDAAGTSGLRGITVEGDVLKVVGPEALAFLELPIGSAAGVQLPVDAVAGAFVQGNLPFGSVRAQSVQATSFGSIIRANGSVVPAVLASPHDAASTLAAGTAIVQAAGTTSVPFSEAQHVALFLKSSHFGGFDFFTILFGDQLNDNASVTAVVAVSVADGRSIVDSIDLIGAGSSIATARSIRSSITSSGPLGDLFMLSPLGITADITAPSIIGNILAVGSISGVVQTTSGDFGRTLHGTSGQIVGVTFVLAGGLTGRLVSRGNLVSSITIVGGMSESGVIAAQGDVGAIQRDAAGNAIVDAANRLRRFGGITVGGSMRGEVAVLGNTFGDVLINGGLKGGRIAVQGQAVQGLPAWRTGILGNVWINGGMDSHAAIVSAGLIGDDGANNVSGDATGTRLTIHGAVKGILAAKRDINFGPVGSLQDASVFENVGATPNPNAAAIDAIFTEIGQPLAFDTLIGGSTGLELILRDLAALRVVNRMLVGPVA